MTPPPTTTVERPENHGLTWTDTRHGHARILTLVGRLEELSAARVRAHIETLVQERPGKSTTVILDLRQVQHLPTAALTALLDTDAMSGLDLRVVTGPHPALSAVRSKQPAPPPVFHTTEAALTPELTEVQRLRTELEQRRQQLAGQPGIEQAKGILMHNFGLTPDEAFALLRRLSQDTNLKVRTIAEQLVTALTGHVTPVAAQRVAAVIEGLRSEARAHG